MTGDASAEYSKLKVFTSLPVTAEAAAVLSSMKSVTV